MGYMGVPPPMGDFAPVSAPVGACPWTMCERGRARRCLRQNACDSD